MTSPTETATERAIHAVKLSHGLSSAQCEALRTAFEDDEGNCHLLTAAANTHLALQRKDLVHRDVDTLTDLGRLVRTVLVEGAAIVLEDAERQDAGPHAIVINKQRHGEVVSVRFASPDRLDDVLFEMGVPPRYRASVRVPRDQRGTYQIREWRYTWAPAATEPAPVTPSTPTCQPRHVADDGTRQAAKPIRTLTPPMRQAIKTIVEDPVAPGVSAADTGEVMTKGIPLPEPGQPLRVIWYVPDEDRAVLWTRDGVTFEAPLVVPPPDPENPYRVDWPLTAWSQARPSNRAVGPIPSVAAVDFDDRREALPCYGMPLLACGDDVLVWKASDGNVYTTPGGTSPLFWDSPGVERGWVVDFTTFEEVHPYDTDNGLDHKHLLERPF